MKLFSWLRGARKTEPVVESLVSTPAFEPQNALEIALIAAAHEASARIEFQKRLLESDLYVATPEAPAAEGSRTLSENTTLQILNVAGQDGAPMPALFTSEARLAVAFGAGTGYVLMPARNLLEMIAEDGAILNPGQSYGVMWSREEIFHLLGRPIQRIIKKDTRVMLGVPAKRPESLIQNIHNTIATEPAIEQAWLALAHWPDEGKSSWFLDIRTTAGQNTTASLLHDILRSGPFDGLPLDLVIKEPSLDAGSGIRIKPAELH